MMSVLLRTLVSAIQKIEKRFRGGRGGRGVAALLYIILEPTIDDSTQRDRLKKQITDVCRALSLNAVCILIKGILGATQVHTARIADRHLYWAENLDTFYLMLRADAKSFNRRIGEFYHVSVQTRSISLQVL